MALLEVSNLKKYFKSPKGIVHAVDDVSFTIDAGKTMGVVGESGCGKTTLGRTVLQLVEPTSGKIIFDGRDISNVESNAEKVKLWHDMQIIFQDPYSSLNPRMTVRQIIAEPLINAKLPKNEINEKVADLLDLVGMPPRLAAVYPHELDGGRRQRIVIARAMALNPKFIVCDEPVSALDVSIQAQILNLMMDLQDERGLTYIFITHDLSVVRHISDDICVMYLGQVVEKAPTKELFNKTLHPYTKGLLSAIPVPNVHIPMRAPELQGEITSPINPPPGCRFAVRCPYKTEQCLLPQELVEIEPNHFVSCCRVKEINGL